MDADYPMRTGPPNSFGWLLIMECAEADMWETPTGYCLFLEKGAWLEEDPAGFITPIDPPPVTGPLPGAH
jgi:hypothetical protein